MPYTGHVTIGGAICIEALTTSGSAGAWRPSMCVESILALVILNMVDCEARVVNTPGGPQRVRALFVCFR